MFGLIRIIFIWARLCTQTRNLSPVDFALFVHIKKKKEITLFSCLSFYFIFVMIFADFQKQTNKEKTPKLSFSEPFFCLMLWMIWNYSLKLFCGFNQRKQFCWVFWRVLYFFFSWFLFLKKRCEGFTKSVSNCEKKNLGAYTPHVRLHCFSRWLYNTIHRCLWQLLSILYVLLILCSHLCNQFWNMQSYIVDFF